MGIYREYQKEIEQKIGKFLLYLGKEHRYASFDFCYLYFYSHRGPQLTEDMEFSCLHLWSYLASWGMLRGSSELLQKSPACLVPLIDHISKANNELWDIDIDKYSEKNIELILNEYKEVKNILSEILNKGNTNEQIVPTKTLITKVMLGVYCNIPAFDTNFCEAYHKIFDKTCKIEKKGKDVLLELAQFYVENKDTFNTEINVIEFNDKAPTGIKYKKVKLLDMYGFVMGGEIVNRKRRERRFKKLEVEKIRAT